MTATSCEFRLRGHPLDPAILEALPGLFARAFRAQGRACYTPQQIEAALESGGADGYVLFRWGTGLVALAGNRPVGCGALGGSDAGGHHDMPTPVQGEEAVVRAFCTDPDFAGRGVGGLVMNGLLALAKESGVRRLRLTATMNAAAFYRRCGFAAETPINVDCGKGIMVPALPMSLTL